jgi:hypothetical protein
VFTAEPSYRDSRTEDSIVLNIADKFLSSAVGASFLDFPNDSSAGGHDSTQISELDTSLTKKPQIPQIQSSFLKLLKVQGSPGIDSFEEYLSKRLKEKAGPSFYN